MRWFAEININIIWNAFMFRKFVEIFANSDLLEAECTLLQITLKAEKVESRILSDKSKFGT